MSDISASDVSAEESDYASSDRSYPDVEYYQEDDLPNFNFRKFVIHRVPGSDFSTDILKIIKRNAAHQPRTILKLMQICKYFCHEEFPFLPMIYIKCCENYGFSYKTLQGQEVEYADRHLLKLFKKKLWITGRIFLDCNLSIKFFLRHIASCDLMELFLEDQILKIDQFKFLTFGGKLKKLCLHTVSLKYENDDPVPLEEILKYIPNIKEFSFERALYYHENVSNFIQVLNPEKMNFFALGQLSESFDFETFITFITKCAKIIAWIGAGFSLLGLIGTASTMNPVTFCSTILSFAFYMFTIVGLRKEHPTWILVSSIIMLIFAVVNSISVVLLIISAIVLPENIVEMFMKQGHLTKEEARKLARTMCFVYAFVNFFGACYTAFAYHVFSNARKFYLQRGSYVSPTLLRTP